MSDTEALAVILVVVFTAFIVLLLFSLVNPQKTLGYRKRLTDLYIAGKIRLFAKEENIDLNKEFERFIINEKALKKQRPGYTLDLAIEDDLMDKISPKEIDVKEGKSNK